MIKADEFLASILNPDDYFCCILVYARSHLQMHIKAENRFNANDFFILSFEQVRYYTGPMRWQGLSFRSGSLSEKMLLLEGGWINVGDLISEFAEMNQLFIFERPGYQVKILAGSFHLGKIEPGVHLLYSDLD